LADVQRLLRQAMTPELEQRLRELDAALGRLDPEATRQALERLAQSQQAFKQSIERSRELFRRAAAEGILSSLEADAKDLRLHQQDWNKRDATAPDSAASMRERALQQRADSLASRIAAASLAVGMDSISSASDEPVRHPSLEAPHNAAMAATRAMDRA